MHQAGLIWAASTIAFFLTAATILVSSSAPEPVQENQAAHSLSNRRATGHDFRRSGFGSDLAIAAPSTVASTGAATDTPSYKPLERVYLAHPSNYGERFSVDASGKPLTNQYVVVLHETVGSAASALNLFQVNHTNDNDQVSYHALIGLDGTIYYVVPPEQRAFGAGDSSFQGAAGEESVVTNASFPSSVNNFAYHVSLETPLDGQNNNRANHSGYTDMQYRSLAWLLARTTVPDERITTHKAVDRSGSRADPRSFDLRYLLQLLHQYPSRASL